MLLSQHNYQLIFPSLFPPTKELDAFLSDKAAVIKAFLSTSLTTQERRRTYVGINDFCFNYPNRTRDFLSKRLHISSALLDSIRIKRIPPRNEIQSFASRLLRMKSECAFLLMDSFEAFNAYKSVGGHGFGIPINRKFLCRDERDYLRLVSLFYKVLLRSSNLDQFLNGFQHDFERLLKRNPHFYHRAQAIYRMVTANQTSKRVVFVDIGFQFTFVLFCHASIRFFSKDLESDFLTFTAYPWLQEFFSTKIYSARNEYGTALESRGRGLYINRSLDRASGTFVGFAIGDALGAPIAGIPNNEVGDYVDYPLKGFTRNSKHPLFPKLRAGQYTANTKLLLLSANHLKVHSRFDLQDYTKHLRNLGKLLQLDQRWLGPTTAQALHQIDARGKPTASRNRSTASCGALYRIVPFAIRYHEDVLAEPDKFVHIIEKVGGVTHNSNVSKAGCTILGLVIASLFNYSTPEGAIRFALKTHSQRVQSLETVLLYRRCWKALLKFRHMTIQQARSEFGTSSNVFETLPLALFCFLKYSNNFKKCVLTAANSCREDSFADRIYLSQFAWEEALVKCKGGNTDGIAAVAGSLSGTIFGGSAISAQFGTLEDRVVIGTIAKRVWKRGKSTINWRNTKM